MINVNNVIIVKNVIHNKINVINVNQKHVCHVIYVQIVKEK